MTPESHDDGLGNQSMLEKIDKLRELNLGTNVPLPQVCTKERDPTFPGFRGR